MENKYLEEYVKIPQLSKGEKVFHYTSAAGLQGILKNKEFWVTESLFLNDTTEFKIGQKIIEEIIKNNISNNIIVNKILNNLNDEVKRNNREKYYYIISCCLDRDSSLMWASYSNFIGYSMEFDFDTLLNSFKMKNVEHGKVIYNHEKQINLVEETINHYLFGKMLVSNVIDEPPLNNWNDLKNANDVIFGMCIFILSLICETYNMFFKKKCFEGEHEYRFIFKCIHESKSNDRSANLDIPREFRIKDEVLIPYIKCSMDNLECLEEILVGPKNNSDIAVRGIEYFLKSNNISASVKKSELPLRY